MMETFYSNPDICLANGLTIKELEDLYGRLEGSDGNDTCDTDLRDAVLYCRLKDHMTVVTGFSKILLTYINSGDKLYSYALQIYKSAGQINKLVAEAESCTKEGFSEV